MSNFKTLSSPYQVTLSPAACSLDIGDGSERGEYVNQDHLLTTLGRPHRAISLMYCYYPLTKGWPLRASIAFKKRGKKGSWDYPYDDYFPFTGGPKGDKESEVFQQMRDIRRHGQDVTLTLTMDCEVPDDHIRAIARQLRPYGRIRVRLNHECDGFWFVFSKRFSYVQVADFFVRFSGILRQEAPSVQLICCWGHVLDYQSGKLNHEEELSPILRAADVWSADQYFTLHYGWPFKSCEPKDIEKTYKIVGVENVWRQIRGIHRRFVQLSGEDKGLEIGEINTDGNVGGEDLQARWTGNFYRKVLREKPEFLKGLTYYQFRDRGRLGLEREDPNNPENGLPTPFLPVYQKLLQDPYFLPKEKWSRTKKLSLEWRASDDSDGLGWKIPLKAKPVFLELRFDKEANLMIRAGKKWFYKKPGVEWVDLTPAAGEGRGSKPLTVAVFAPPSDGMNRPGASFVPAKLSRAPQLRLIYRWKGMD